MGFRGTRLPCRSAGCGKAPAATVRARRPGCRKTVDRLLKFVKNNSLLSDSERFSLSITSVLCTARCELSGKYTSAAPPLSRGGRSFSMKFRKNSRILSTFVCMQDTPASPAGASASGAGGCRCGWIVAYRMDDGHSSAYSRCIVSRYDAFPVWYSARR